MILYLHGFASGAASTKALWLQKHLSGVDFIVPDYPSHRPREAVQLLSALVEEHLGSERNPIRLVMGSSMGGYYAQYLANRYSLALVMINPALNPIDILSPHVGMHQNYVTGDPVELTAQHIAELVDYEVDKPALDIVTLLLVDTGDEVIDAAFAMEKYHGIGQSVCYPGGDHYFRHLDQALPLIEQAYRDSIKVFKK